MIRKLGIGLAFALAASACSCEDQVEKRPETAVAITSPADGVVLTLRDDVAHDQAGLQIEVRGTASGFGDAATATLRLDGNETGQQVALAAGAFVFPALTLEAGARVLTVSVSGDGLVGEAAAAVVADDDPLPDSLEIAATADGARFNAEADASPEVEGLQTEVVVRSVMLSGGTVRLCLAAEGFTGLGACKQASGSILAEAPLAANGVTSFQVTLPEGLALPLSAEWEKEGATTLVAAPVSVNVDTVAPAVAFVVPVEGELIGAQSFDVLLQTDAEEGQVAAVTSSALEGERFEGAVDAEGGVTVHVTLPIGAQTLTALVADKAGNPSALASVGVMVDVDGCDVELSAPAGSSFVFNTVNSQVGEAGGTFTLTGRTTRCAGGEVRFTKTVGGATTELGQTTAAEDGSFSFAATFPDGEQDAVLNVKVVKDLSPNDGFDLPYSTDFTVPVVSFRSPLEGQTLTSQSIRIQASVAGAEPGRVVTFHNGATELGSAALDDSLYAAIDANLPLGPVAITAELTDAAGNPGSGTVNALVDLEGCDVELTNPVGSSIVFNLGNTSAAEGGRSFQVAGKTQRCAEGTAEFTRTAAGVTTPIGSAPVGADGTFVFPAILADGEVDATLNVKVVKNLAPNAGVGFAYRTDFVAPTIAFVSPTDEQTVTSLATTLEVQVTGAELDQPVSFKAAGVAVGSGSVDAAWRASANVNLGLGRQTLRAEVADAAGNQASAEIDVMVDTDGCDVALSAPTESQVVFNLANTSTDATGRFAAVSGSTTRCAEGTVRLTKTVGATVSTIEAAVLADGTFSVKLPLSDGEQDAGVNVKIEKGLAPNAGVGFTYRADFTAPTIAFTSPTDGQTVTSLTPTLEVATTGVEQDQEVAFKRTGTALPIGTGAVSAAGVASAAVNLTTGSHTLTAEVTDAAGNPASATIQILVDTAGCDVVLANLTAEKIFFLGNTDPGVAPLRTYKVVGSSSLCPEGTAHFTKTVGGVDTVLGTVGVDAAGNFEFVADLADGEADATLNVKVVKNLAPNAGVSVSYSADFTPPSLDLASPDEGDLFVVHQNNTRLLAGEPGFVADADPATAGGQLDLALTVSGVGTIGSAGEGRVVLALGSSELFNQTYASNAQQTVAQRFTLPEGYNGPMTASLTDAAGNTASGTWNVRVATVALPVPTIALPTAGTINVFRDLGGDRATYAAVQGNVNFSAAAPAGVQIRVCSTVQFSGAAACGQAGYYELPNTAMTASGTGQFYASLRLPQGVQTISAELTDNAGSLAASAAVALTVDTVPPQVTSFVSVEDANHDGLLTGTELPSGQPSHFTAQVTGAEGRQMSLWDGATKLATVNVASGTANFTVTSLADGLHALKVLVTDAANNPNESTSVSPAISNPAASLALNVKRVAPSIAVVAPGFTMCNLALDKEKATEECEVDFTVAVSAGATRVDFSGPGSPNPASVTSFTNSRATATYTLGQGGPFALVATVYDSAGNARQATVNLSVDTIAPTLAFTSPADGETFTSQNIPVSLTTDAEVGRTVKVTSSLNGAEVGSGAVAADGTASFTVRVPYGSQSLNASVSDLAGNVANAAPVAIGIDLAGCDINFTNPVATQVVFNKANTPASGSVTITGNSLRGDCPGQSINFYAAVNGAPESLIGTRTIDASGNFSIDYSFGDGTVTVFTAETTYNTTNRSSFTATTDLTPPTLTINSPVPSSENKLFVVAQAGNINVRDGVAGYLPDADAAPDGQVNFNLTVVGGGSFDGSANGRVVVMQGANEVASQVISDNGTVAVNALAATLEQAFVGTLTVMVTDSAGNSAGANWDLTVDVVPPGSPTIVMADQGNGHVTNVVTPRGTDIDVWLVSPADDGPGSSSVAWELGWTTETKLLGATLDTIAFDDANKTTRVALPAPISAGIEQLVNLSALPPLNTFHIGARASDGVGNQSELQTATMTHGWQQETLAYTGTTTTPASFGAKLAAGDIDGDGSTDLVVGAWAENSNTGSIKIFYGGMSASAIQTLVGTAANTYLGSGLALMDIDGDGRTELLTRDGTRFAVFDAPAQGQQLGSTPVFRFSTLATTAKQVGDLNGDGVPDLALGNWTASTNLGKVHVFFGRPDWSGLIVDGIVDVGQADATITGSDTNGRLTGMDGLVSLEDCGALPSPCLAVGAYNAAKVYVFDRTSFASTGAALTPANAAVSFAGVAGSGFGYLLTATDVNGDHRDDLVVSALLAGEVYAALNVGTGFATPSLFSRGASRFGSSFAVGDLNLDGNADLAVGGNSSSQGPLWLFWSAPQLAVPAGTYLTGGSAFGISTLIADVNGDAREDLLIGDYANGNGQVRIYY